MHHADVLATTKAAAEGRWGGRAQEFFIHLPLHAHSFWALYLRALSFPATGERACWGRVVVRGLCCIMPLSCTCLPFSPLPWRKALLGVATVFPPLTFFHMLSFYYLASCMRKKPSS